MREIIDIPEKVAIKIGAVGLILSLFYSPAFMPSLKLITGGSVSLGITQGIWPKKQKAA